MDFFQNNRFLAYTSDLTQYYITTITSNIRDIHTVLCLMKTETSKLSALFTEL